jgi:hypothetical protein
VIVSNLKGGLGNQLFQYACARTLALRLNQDLLFYYDKSLLSSSREIIIDKMFNLKLKRSSFLNLSSILFFPAISLFRNLLASKNLRFFRPSNFITEPSFLFWPNLFCVNNRNIYLHGYWQSYKYFIEYSKILARDFSFNDKFLFKNKTNSYLKKILLANAISIHLRRGDFLTNPRASKFHGVCELSYYKKSIKYILKKVKDPHFFIFSDDIKWAKANLIFGKNSFTYVENNSDAVDFWLMSLCKHNILANSTFSWWAAWLNKNDSKIIIAPKRWFLDTKTSADDLMPKNWFRF